MKITYAKFDARMIRILTSRDLELNDRHRVMLLDILTEVDPSDRVNFVTEFYNEGTKREDIRVGELEYIAELLKCKVVVNITFIPQ